MIKKFLSIFIFLPLLPLLSGCVKCRECEVNVSTTSQPPLPTDSAVTIFLGKICAEDLSSIEETPVRTTIVQQGDTTTTTTASYTCR